jgi:hypothetical protein
MPRNGGIPALFCAGPEIFHAASGFLREGR